MLGMGIANKANAQLAYADSTTINPKSAISYALLGQFKNATGERIKKADMRNYLDAYQYADYSKYIKRYYTGLACTGVGLGLIGVGASQSNKSSVDGDLNALLLIPLGAVSTIVGVPLTLIGSRNLHKLAKNYNTAQSQSPTLTFGGQQYGIGLAFKF